MNMKVSGLENNILCQQDLEARMYLIKNAPPPKQNRSFQYENRGACLPGDKSNAGG